VDKEGLEYHAVARLLAHGSGLTPIGARVLRDVGGGAINACLYRPGCSRLEAMHNLWQCQGGTLLWLYAAPSNQRFLDFIEGWMLCGEGAYHLLNHRNIGRRQKIPVGRMSAFLGPGILPLFKSLPATRKRLQGKKGLTLNVAPRGVEALPYHGVYKMANPSRWCVNQLVRPDVVTPHCLLQVRKRAPLRYVEPERRKDVAVHAHDGGQLLCLAYKPSTQRSVEHTPLLFVKFAG
jgi:hypothetical protein